MNNQGVNTIFCDESGFTGNDLYSPAQPYFVYSSVKISPLEADEIVQQVKTDFKITTQELKGSNLLRTNIGKLSITWILEKYSSKACIIAYDKRYALACKFFEYIFEPIISTNNLLFYNIGFHRFISSVLYLHFLVGKIPTENILINFQAAIRSKNISDLEKVFNISDHVSNKPDFLHQILIFATYHRAEIYKEFEYLREDDVTSTWILELTLSALFSLLTKWGEDIDGMEVYCDDSKPLVTQGDFFDVMVHRNDRQFINIGGRDYPLTFNLVSPIQLVSSKKHTGIQLADIFASSIAYALKNNDNFSRHCIEICDKSICESSVFPQLEYADLSKKPGFINASVLTELYRRTLIRQNLLDGMESFISSMEKLYLDSINH